VLAIFQKANKTHLITATDVQNSLPQIEEFARKLSITGS